MSKVIKIEEYRNRNSGKAPNVEDLHREIDEFRQTVQKTEEELNSLEDELKAELKARGITVEE